METITNKEPDTWAELWPSPSNFNGNRDLLNNIITDYYAWHGSQQSLEYSGANRLSSEDPLWGESAQLLHDLSQRLQETSVPWPHPEYLAHMNTDVILPSSLAYFTAMLYNPNNVTPEASPLTTELEYELSDDFCTLFGFDPKQGWAHLTSGGHGANYEAIWIARNLKYVPLAAEQFPELKKVTENLITEDTLNLAPSDVAMILDEARMHGQLEDLLKRAAMLRQQSSSGKGRLLVPANRHYAWDKCADLLDTRLETIDVDSSMRMDIDKLRTRVQTLLRDKQPIVAIVATVGSSGEGSVDEIHRILALREECERLFKASFFLHVDAAFGGYFRTILIPPPVAHDCKQFKSATHNPVHLLKPEVINALTALKGVDTITVDPHKCGYVPYPAGCLTIRDRRFSFVVSSQNKYFGQSQQSEHMDFGPYTLEGARPGAAAAAVWIAHRLLGLHREGYGVLLSENILTAQRLNKAINHNSEFLLQGKPFHLQSIFEPDLNMINFIARPSKELAISGKQMTALSEKIIATGSGNVQSAAPWFSRNKINYPLDKGCQEEISAVRCCIMKSIPEQGFQDFWKVIFDKITSRIT